MGSIMENPIKTYRERKQLSRKDLAKILDVSRQLISHIENGRRQITPENAVKWEKLIGLSRQEMRPDMFDVPVKARRVRSTPIHR